MTKKLFKRSLLLTAIQVLFIGISAQTGEEPRTLKGHTSQVNSVAFSPDGKLLASGSSDHTIKLWDVDTGKELKTLRGHTIGGVSVVFSPDGKLLASASKTIKLWDVNTGKELKTLKWDTSSVDSVAFSPDGKTLASGSSDTTIKLWDVDTGKELKTLRGHGRWVSSFAFSPDGKLLASSSGDKTIKLWDVNTGKELKTLRGHTDEVYSVALSPDGKLLASSSSDKTVKLWDVDTGKELKTLRGHTFIVTSVAFSPDGKLLASGSKAIKLWDVNTGKELKTLGGHTDGVSSVAFSPDGKTLASGGWLNSNSIKLWNLNGTPVSTATSPTRTASLEIISEVEQFPVELTSRRVELIFDASGSMLGKLGNKTKIEIAKQVTKNLIEKLPDEIEVGLRVFGHRRKGDCSDIEMVSPFAKLDRRKLTDRIESINALGITPLAGSLKLVAKDLAEFKGETTLIVLTDGKEQCRGNPVAEVRKLQRQGIDVSLHIIGFSVADQEISQLREIAGAGKGQFHRATNEDELISALRASFGARFEVRDATGTVVAKGVTGAEKLKLTEGVYRVVIKSKPAIEIKEVRLKNGHTTTIVVTKKGDKINTEVKKPSPERSPD